MKGTKAAIRYAKAIYQLAKAENNLELITQDIRLMEQTIAESKDLQHLLKTPMVSPEQKRVILEKVVGQKIQALSFRLIELLIANGREYLLPFVCEAFIKEYNLAHQIGKVKVASAIALNRESKQQIEKTLREKYQFSKIELSETVQEDLIGGMILTIGDQQLDGSIKRKLKDIRKELIHT